MNITKVIGRVLGPLSFFLILTFFHPIGLSQEANAVLATTVLIAIW
jgi:sodium-dependent dicarboxylate transporter 2/3/5